MAGLTGGGPIMHRTALVGYWFPALLGGVFLLAGCRHDAHGPSCSLFGNDEPTQLTDAQTADLKVTVGRAREKQGDVEQATAAYLEAVKLDPKRADAYVRLAILSDRQNKARDAA